MVFTQPVANAGFNVVAVVVPVVKQEDGLHVCSLMAAEHTREIEYYGDVSPNPYSLSEIVLVHVFCSLNDGKGLKP